MGPPLFAPLLFAVPGYLGLVASLLRREDDPAGRFLPAFARRPRWALWLSALPRTISREGLSLWGEVREGKFQRHMAASAAAAALFSGLEAGYSHYKNRFKYRVEWTPIASAALLTAAGVGAIWSRRAAHRALPATSALAIANGVLGFFYHGRGIVRRPGGLSLPLHNVMYGPPIFAPLLLGAAGFMGLCASVLRRER